LDSGVTAIIEQGLGFGGSLKEELPHLRGGSADKENAGAVLGPIGIGDGREPGGAEADKIVEVKEVLEAFPKGGVGKPRAKVFVEGAKDVVTGAAGRAEDVRGDAEKDAMGGVMKGVGGREKGVDVACPGVVRGGEEAVAVHELLGVGTRAVVGFGKVGVVVAVPLLKGEGESLVVEKASVERGAGMVVRGGWDEFKKEPVAPAVLVGLGAAGGSFVLDGAELELEAVHTVGVVGECGGEDGEDDFFGDVVVGGDVGSEGLVDLDLDGNVG
jgi:hypothetical protein